MADFHQLNAIPILDVASRLGMIVKKNKALCFMHNEKTPSLSFSVERNMWKCFGCSNFGGVIDLVMKKTGMNFREACHWLDLNYFVGRASLKGPYKSLIHRPILPSRNSFLELGADSELYEKIIEILPISKKAFDYLTIDRAIDERIINENGIKSIDNISRFYAKMHDMYSDERLILAGLLCVSDTSQIKHVWWRDGIVFPYYNIDGRVSMLQLRPYIPDPPGIKYILLKGIKSCLYNEKIMKELPVGSTLFICEGAPDTLSLLTKGIPAVGVPGVASFKDEWIEMIGQYNITILFDNDEAGDKNAIVLGKKLKDNGVNVSVRKLLSYHDVNEMLAAERNLIK